MIKNRTGAGSDFLGWSTWPKDYDKEEFERIKKAAKEIRDNYEVLVVVGIGGSTLFFANNPFNASIAHLAPK